MHLLTTHLSAANPSNRRFVEQRVSGAVTCASADAPVTDLATERLEAELIDIVGSRAVQLRRLLHLIAEYDRRGVWIGSGVSSCAHWLADTAGIEICTAREQIRVAHALARLPLIDAAFSDQRLSYSKVRAITRVATPDDEDELIELGQRHSAGELGRALAARNRDRLDPKQLADRQHEQRSCCWKIEPDGMVAMTVRMTPEQAGMVIASIDAGVMANNPPAAPAAASDEAPSLAQQRCDALVDSFRRAACKSSPDLDGVSPSVELVIHAHHALDGRLVGTLADGTPLRGAAVEELACSATIRALMHSSDGEPIDATTARRGPTKRQMRLLTERDRHCSYGRCKSTDFLHAHHIIHRTNGGPTTIDNLTLLCGYHHRHIHNHEPDWQPPGFRMN